MVREFRKNGLRVFVVAISHGLTISHLPYTLLSMAAAYGFHLCQNHPFIDGNKRVAGMAMLTFLQLNGLTPTVPEMEYYTVMMAVAICAGKNGVPNGSYGWLSLLRLAVAVYAPRVIES